MVTITFPDREVEKRALAFLLSRFSGRILRTGEHLVPEAALEALADQNIPFSVKSKATQEQQLAALGVLLPIRFKWGSRGRGECRPLSIVPMPAELRRGDCRERTSESTPL
jgi:hypothetical protein